jgi:hypothetical protein
MSVGSFNFPIVITASGLQPQSPASIQSQLIANVAATNPGYTANLPASMIEDISSTDVAAIAMVDQSKVEAVNCLTPYGCNVFVLGQQGQIYIGQSQPGLPTNTSVTVVFSGTVGYVIANGFLVGDGTNTYQCQSGGVIGTDGSSLPILALAIQPGAFGVGATTVTVLVTSVPGSITLTVTNPAPGTPALAAEQPYAYRARILQAGLASSVGTPRYIKTQLAALQPNAGNLVSVQQASGGGTRVVVGLGADPYQIAYAISISVADVSDLVGTAGGGAGGTSVTVGLYDYPDNYSVVYVQAAVQTVTMAIVWNTTLSGFGGGGAFQGLVQEPLAAYINSLAVGQVINVLEMNEIFQEAVAGVLDPSLLTRLVFTVEINSSVVAPGSGTYAITGDTEGYFTCVATGITVTQG